MIRDRFEHLVLRLKQGDIKTFIKTVRKSDWGELAQRDISVFMELGLLLDKYDDWRSIEEKCELARKTFPVLLKAGFAPWCDPCYGELYLQATIFGGDGAKPITETEKKARQHLNTWVELLFEHNVVDSCGGHAGHYMAHHLVVSPWYFQSVPSSAFALPDANGNTMLHLIFRDSMQGYDWGDPFDDVVKSVTLCLKHGCRWDSPNAWGHTPLSLFQSALKEHTGLSQCDDLLGLLSLAESTVLKQQLKQSLEHGKGRALGSPKKM